MTTLKQSTARNVMVKLFLTSDHLTGATGKTLTVTLSKDGAAFAAAGATVTERTSGWYQIALTTTDANTLGDLVIRATAAACDDAERLVEIVSYDPQSATNLGLSNLNAASSTLATQASVDTIDDLLDAEVLAIYNRLGAPVGASLSADIAARASQTSVTTIDANLEALSLSAATQATSNLIKAKTDNLPAAPAAVSDIPSAATVAAAVWAFVIEGAYTAKDYMRLFASSLLALVAGGGTATITFRDTANSKTRITATVDEDGNRTSVTLDAS